MLINKYKAEFFQFCIQLTADNYRDKRTKRIGAMDWHCIRCCNLKKQLLRSILMANYIIQISDDALMEMSIAALEAYVVPQRQANKSGERLKKEVETYGLLWGHGVTLPDGDILYSVQKLTVDAMAYRRTDSVLPSEGLKVIKDMITSYWPQYSFLGDFHSHPYEHYNDVERIRGYEFSEVDRKSMIDEQNDPDFRVSLVMTISSLERISNIQPENISDSIICWTFNNYRFWLNACIVYKGDEDDEIALLPNSSHWKNKYDNPDDVGVYLHCPYLSHPWQTTRFGKKVGKGKHIAGDI